MSGQTQKLKTVAVLQRLRKLQQTQAAHALSIATTERRNADDALAQAKSRNASLVDRQKRMRDQGQAIDPGLYEYLLAASIEANARVEQCITDRELAEHRVKEKRAAFAKRTAQHDVVTSLRDELTRSLEKWRESAEVSDRSDQYSRSRRS